MQKRRSSTSKHTKFKTNIYGVKVPIKTYNQYVRDIRKINTFNMKRYERIMKEPLKLHGKPTVITVGERIAMQARPKKGKVLSQKYGTMQTELQNAFQYIKDENYAKEYFKNVHKRASPKYMQKQAEQLKKNYLKSMRRNFGDEKGRINIRKANAVYKKIKSLSSEELEFIIETNEHAEIQYQYSDRELAEKLEELSSIFF